MPYADPERQKAAKAKWFRERYQDRAFAEAEKQRKAAWYIENAEHVYAKVVERRAALREVQG